MIAAKVANALALDYPRERLQIVVASDGSTDATAERARAAGADLVLELPPGGKVAALNAAAELATGDLLAFSDANSAWAPRRPAPPGRALRRPGVGYVCGQVRFVDAGGDNLEGAYWRYEMAVRRWSRRWPGSPPATAPSTRSAAAPTCRCRRPAATTSPSPSSWPSAACARSTRRRRGRRRRWSRPWRASSPANGG